jgi:Bacteriophage related domain of unknown function
MFEAKQTAIEEFFKTGFNQSEIVFENSPSPSPDLYDDFVRLVVAFGESKRMQIGGNGYRYPGLVMVQVMCKEGVGINRGVVLADHIHNLFRDVVHSGINFQVPYVTKFPFAEKGWFQVQVSIPFYFDEVS